MHFREMRGRGRGDGGGWDPDADANETKEEERENIDLRQEKQRIIKEEASICAVCVYDREN